jgi:amino acid adenylation domain-containing protein
VAIFTEDNGNREDAPGRERLPRSPQPPTERMESAMAFPSLQGRFDEQVARTPDAIAVVSGQVRWTYRELNRRADLLARVLRRLGVGPEIPVPILMERSAGVILAVLAVLKAGGCYLPLHSAFPPERLQWILDQAAGPVLLADEVMRDRGLPRGGTLVLVGSAGEITAEPGREDDGPMVPGDGSQAAYLMFTSGSTGKPKGVTVTHRNVLELVSDSSWDSGAYERVLMVAPYAFSVSTFEIWVPLLRGGRVVVAPPGVLAVGTLERLVAEEGITGLHLTAGLFRVVGEEAPTCFTGVREVLTGGDVIAPAAVDRVLRACPGIVVRAMYGATETTLFTMTLAMTAGQPPGTAVPVGFPMDGVRPYVLDERLRPAESGELYVGGERLARGYFGNPELTAAQYVADPFAGPGQRMYRTGDLVRRRRDGPLEFAGRVGDLVKIRGFRVELGEVEAALSTYPGLVHAAVVAREAEPGDRRIAAYLVTESGGFDRKAVRDHLLTSLPEYAVPEAFVAVPSLPLTPNGKLDRRALPEPGFDATPPYRAPDNHRQEVLCSVFAEVLGVPAVGIDDSFFELGGQSLQATRLISRIRSALGVAVSFDELFNAPTVSDLDGHLSGPG